MKQIFTTLTIFSIGLMSFAQIQTKPANFDCKSTNQEATKNISLATNYEKNGVVLLETFDTWPPTGWTIIDGPDSQDTQHWHQGGNETNYKATVQWSSDNTARPQDEWLITPEIQVPELGFLSFRMNSNPYWMVTDNNNADVFVKITTDDGTTWTQLWHEDDEDFVFQIWRDVFIDLETYIGQNVKIAFQYIGSDACWFDIDDVSVFTFPKFNIELIDARINFFELPDYVTEPSHFHMSSHYQMIPIQELENNNFAILGFNAIVTNKGYGTCTPQCEISILDPNNIELFTQISTNTNTIGEFDVDTIDIGFIEPYILNTPQLGVYTVNYTITYQESGAKEILVGSTNFEVTNSVYARENGNINGTTGPSAWVGGKVDGNKMGLMYTIFNDTEITSIDAFISESSTVGTSLIAHIMLINEGGWYPMTSSPLINIVESDIGAWKNITFTDLTLVTIDPQYDAASVLVALEFYYGTEPDNDLTIGEDKTVPSSFWGTKWALGEDAASNSFPAFTNYSGVPMIRINYPNADNSAPQNFTQKNINMYPNPSTGIVTISNVEGATIEIINIMGQVVASVQNANDINNINLSNNAEGTYIVRITNGNEISTSKLNLVK